MGIDLLLLAAYAGSKRIDQKRRRAAAKAEQDRADEALKPKYFGYRDDGSFVAGALANSPEYSTITNVTHFQVGNNLEKLEKPFVSKPVYFDTANRTQVSAEEYARRSSSLESASVPVKDTFGRTLTDPANLPQLADMSNIVQIGSTTPTGVAYLPSKALDAIFDDGSDGKNIFWNNTDYGAGAAAISKAMTDRATSTGPERETSIVAIGKDGVPAEVSKGLAAAVKNQPFYVQGNPYDSYDDAYAAFVDAGMKFPIQQSQVSQGQTKMVTVTAAEEKDDEDPLKTTVYRIGKKIYKDRQAAKQAAEAADIDVTEIEVLTETVLDDEGEIVSVGGVSLFAVPEIADDKTKKEGYVEVKTSKGILTEEEVLNLPDTDPDKIKFLQNRLPQRPVTIGDDGGITKGTFTTPSSSSATSSQSKAIDLAEFTGPIVKIDNPDMPGEKMSIGFGFPTGSGASKEPRDRINAAISSVIDNPEAFKVLQADDQKYAQFLDTVANEVLESYKDDTQANVATGVTPNLPFDVLSITQDYAMKKYESLKVIPGIEAVLSAKFDEKLEHNRTFAQQDAADVTGAGMVAESIVEIPDPANPDQFVRRRVIMGIAYDPKYAGLVDHLVNRQGMSPDAVASLMRHDGDPVTGRRGATVSVASANQPLLDFAQTLYSKPFMFDDNTGKRRQGNLLDAFTHMITPDSLRQFESLTVSGVQERQIAELFINATEGRPEEGIKLIENLMPQGSNISKRVLTRQFGSDHMHKISLDARASSAAAGQAFQTLNNIRATYFFPKADGSGPDFSRPLDLTMQAGEFVLGIDGFLYLVRKGSDFISRGIGHSIVRQEDLAGLAPQVLARAQGLVMSPEQAARSAEEGGRGQDAEANRRARENNAALFNSIVADLNSDEFEIVTINGRQERVAKKLLASRRLYKYLSAYQMAAAIQGGTGGRTISDQDVENMLAAFNFTTFSTPEAELATIDAASGMMLRIRDVDAAIGSNDNKTRYAGIVYADLEGKAQGTATITVYDDVLSAADFLEQPGARGRPDQTPTAEPGTIDISTFNNFILSSGGNPIVFDNAQDAQNKAKEHPLYQDYLRTLR